MKKYFYKMISSFKHKGLQLFWETGNAKKIPFDQVDKIRRILDVLDIAILVPQDLLAYKNWRIILNLKIKWH